MVHETLAYAAFRAVGVPAAENWFRVRARERRGLRRLPGRGDSSTTWLSRAGSPRRSTSTRANYTNDVLPGASGSFEVDEGSDTRSERPRRADRGRERAPAPGRRHVEPVRRPRRDDADVGRRAVHRPLGRLLRLGRFRVSATCTRRTTTSSTATRPDGSRCCRGGPTRRGRRSHLPPGSGSTTAQAIMFTRCLADPGCAALYRNAVAAAASTIAGLDLDGLADATAAMLRPVAGARPTEGSNTRRRSTSSVAGVHDYLAVARARRCSLADAAGRHRRARSVTERRPAGIAQPVTIDWQATDTSGSPTDPPDTPRLDRGRERHLYERAELRPVLELRDRIPRCSASTQSPQRWRRRSARRRSCYTEPRLRHHTRPTRPPESPRQSCQSPDTSTAGAHTLTCTATDIAGNTTTVTVPYVVEYRILGFLSPSANAKWKSGQTVPIKVALGDANGHRIPDAEAQALLSPTVSSRVRRPPAPNPLSACMKYDTANHQLIYNWKLGQPIGAVTISVQVGYIGTTTKTVISEPITITK